MAAEQRVEAGTSSRPFLVPEAQLSKVAKAEGRPYRCTNTQIGSFAWQGVVKDWGKFVYASLRDPLEPGSEARRAEEENVTWRTEKLYQNEFPEYRLADDRADLRSRRRTRLASRLEAGERLVRQHMKPNSATQKTYNEISGKVDEASEEAAAEQGERQRRRSTGMPSLMHDQALEYYRNKRVQLRHDKEDRPPPVRVPQLDRTRRGAAMAIPALQQHDEKERYVGAEARSRFFKKFHNAYDHYSDDVSGPMHKEMRAVGAQVLSSSSSSSSSRPGSAFPLGATARRRGLRPLSAPPKKPSGQQGAQQEGAQQQQQQEEEEEEEEEGDGDESESESEDDDKEDEADEDFASSPRQRFFNECRREQLLPEPLLIRKDDSSALKLGHYGIGNEMGSALAKSLRHVPNVESVDLSDNRLDYRAICETLKTLGRRGDITHINLSRNPISRVDGTEMASLISSNHALRHLSLAHARIGDGFAVPLARALRHSEIKHLDLSYNEIGRRGGDAFAELVADHMCKLSVLNLSWNNVSGPAAVAFGKALELNRSLHELYVAYNGFGSLGGQAVAFALIDNNSLLKLDISNNNITGAGAQVFGLLMNRTQTLQHLALGGNPIGQVGVRAVLRALLRETVCTVDLTECNTETVEPHVFDPQHIERFAPYSLQLSGSPYDYTVAIEVLRAAGDYPNISITQLSHTAPGARRGTKHKLQWAEGVLVDAATGYPFAVPDRGRLDVQLSYRPGRPLRRLVADDDGLMRVAALVTDCATPTLSERLLEVAMHDALIDCRQVRLLAARLAEVVPPLQLIRITYPRILDTENIFSTICMLLPSTEQRHELIASLGMQTFCAVDRNPCGRWLFNLSDPVHRRDLGLLQQVNGDDVEFSMRRAQRNDTSQLGDWTGWRNAKWRGEACVLTAEWFKSDHSTRGTLEVDFVSTQRPPGDRSQLEPITAEALEAITDTIGLHKNLVWLPVEAQQMAALHIAELRVAMAAHYVSAAQTRSLCEYYPRGNGAERILVATTLFSRVLDLENFDCVLACFSDEERLEVIRRLGVLNVMNPRKIEGVYELHLESPDERQMLRVIKEVALVEPGDNVQEDEDRNDFPFYKICAMGDVPTSGTMAIAYEPSLLHQTHWNKRVAMLRHFLLGTAVMPKHLLHPPPPVDPSKAAQAAAGAAAAANEEEPVFLHPDDVSGSDSEYFSGSESSYSDRSYDSDRSWYSDRSWSDRSGGSPR